MLHDYGTRDDPTTVNTFKTTRTSKSIRWFYVGKENWALGRERRLLCELPVTVVNTRKQDALFPLNI
jgi:hypothetical protein